FAEYENPGGTQQYLVRYVYRAPTGGYTREYIGGLGAFPGIYNELALDPAGGGHVVYTDMTTNNSVPHLTPASPCRGLLQRSSCSLVTWHDAMSMLRSTRLPSSVTKASLRI